ncbi:MAG: anthranilate synthase component I, partial [Halobacteriales archaeon]|nr:anthranilate synthase component I [Halobacteriales archaeon]
MPSLVTDAATFRRVATDVPATARVPVELQLTVADPFDAYRRARTEGDPGVYLATTGGQSGWGYFGVDPIDLVEIGPESAGRDRARSPTLDAIEGRLAQETLVRGECDVPYPCGAVGWLSYDIAREIEDLPDHTPEDRGLPRAQLAVFDTLVAWEEPRDREDVTLRITACPTVGDDPTE